ncbi:MAG: AIM24 family protein [Lachnospiraceae bacterium]|nr:AIM24 family protein [Lachnospiraceae bacterium]
MHYRVEGAPMPAVTIKLEQGESIYTQSGGMTWMSDGISMETNMKGGLMKGIGRMFSGDIAQKNAFLCATPNVVLSAYVTGAKSGFFGGEGFVLQRYSGQGMAFLELDGTIVEKELAPGEKIKVDTGNIAFFEAGVGYSSEMVKGFANILFGGEGLFLSTLTGPGKVWLQTMSVSELAKRIIPFIPSGK